MSPGFSLPFDIHCAFALRCTIICATIWTVSPLLSHSSFLLLTAVFCPAPMVLRRIVGRSICALDLVLIRAPHTDPLSMYFYDRRDMSRYLPLGRFSSIQRLRRYLREESRLSSLDINCINKLVYSYSCFEVYSKIYIWKVIVKRERCSFDDLNWNRC